MKILHVIDRLETGGAEKILVHLTRLLVASGVETGVLLFAAGSPLGHELDKRLQVHLLNRKNKFNPFNLFKAHRLCSRYNIVHTHLRHVHAYIRLAQLLFNGKYKVMLHDHASPTAGIPARLKGFFKPRYYIGVNQDQIAWAENSVGIDRKNIFLLENTVAAQPAGTAIILKTLRAIMVANIRRVKNIEFAIALCRKMDWQLDIYGNVIEPDYHSELLTLAGNDGSVNIKTGITDFSATYPQYRLAIHCSPQETGPLVLIEYLAAGLPFIAYKTGSAAETIAVELPQLFMNNFDHEEWVQRIPEIITDTVLPGRMQRLYKQKFNPDDYISKCLEIYKNVLS